MLIGDPLDALAEANRRSHRLRADAAVERLRGTPLRRRALAASLRFAADRLDPAPLARTPAGQL